MKGSDLAEPALGPDDERALLERARAGDREAFAELTCASTAQVSGMLFQMLGARADLDDLLQDTWTRALRALPGFRGDAAFSTWVSRIAVNLALSELRRRRIRETAPLEDRAGRQEEPWVHAGRVEIRERMAAAVDRLPPAMKEVFELRYRTGLDSRRISERLAIPAPTVRTRLFHARRRLREALDDLLAD